MTREALKEAFPGFEEKLMAGFVEMLVFDAMIGHNDRHPYNWGVIVPLRKSNPPRFSPVFDTARALFWNIPEKRIRRMLENTGEFEAYIQKCEPPVGWDGEQGIAFFRLISLIWKSFPNFGKHIEKFLDADLLRLCYRMIDKEFGYLMSVERRILIKKCLHLRQQYLKEMCKI